MTCRLGGQRCGGDDAQESVSHLGVDLQRRDPCCDVEGVLVHRRLELCSAAMLLPCAATCPSVVARAATVARGAIAGASALLSSFEASSAVTRSSRDWMAAALLPDAAVFTARSATCA